MKTISNIGPLPSSVTRAVTELSNPQFYANHDGVLMYEDSISSRWSGGEFQAAGIAFFPIGEWAEKSSEMRGELVGHGLV